LSCEKLLVPKTLKPIWVRVQVRVLPSCVHVPVTLAPTRSSDVGVVGAALPLHAAVPENDQEGGETTVCCGHWSSLPSLALHGDPREDIYTLDDGQPVNAPR
jgi:hypothetical protein